MSPSAILLVVTIGLFTVYVIGVGGTTATALRVREAWRHRKVEESELAPAAGADVVLNAPALSPGLLRLRWVGWIAFVPALVLAVFAVHDYQWVAPVVVLLMVALNAFYFTAMQNIGEQLTFTADGFRVGVGSGARTVRWVHVTELAGARVGGRGGVKMPEEDEWQDPRLRPNVIVYRLNRALTTSRRSLFHRLIGFTYYDGVIRNAFGVPTAVLLRSMREWQRRALEAEKVPPRPSP